VVAVHDPYPGVVALDRSVDMLSWRRAEGPPGVAGELTALPLCDDAVDDAVAEFVLNHLTEPVLGLRELARFTRPGGAVLATVYAATSGSRARDRVDEIALAHGFRWPWRPPRRSCGPTGRGSYGWWRGACRTP
jgi:ubiquinone/menaquinone biosynthesis C-methylase UbiE